MTNRTVFRISGDDAQDFLQGLVTNDVTKASDGLVYAALLTPQGKYLADFFLGPLDDGVLLDAETGLADALAARLSMYKLRAEVTIERTALCVHRGVGACPPDGLADPRHASLGWRAYRDTPADQDDVDWDSLRVAECIPETNIELTADSYILEAGFERLNGVDFRKGCYVGQEVTARMKHKTELRKGLQCVAIDGAAPVGTAITANGKTVGQVFTQSGGKAIAYLRYDKAQPEMAAGPATVRLLSEAVAP
jgi:folate-binding protein YgfZ